MLYLQVAALGAAAALLGCSKAKITSPSAAGLARQSLVQESSHLDLL